MTMAAISTPLGIGYVIAPEGGGTASSSWSSWSSSPPPTPLILPTAVLSPTPPREPEPLLPPPPLPLFLGVGGVWSCVVGGVYGSCDCKDKRGEYVALGVAGSEWENLYLRWRIPMKSVYLRECWDQGHWLMYHPFPVWYNVLWYWLTGWWGGWTRWWTIVTRKPMLEVCGDQFGLEYSWG